jgi:hypothetical protein
MMTLSRPRLQVVQNDEIAEAIAIIRKHRPGLINDSMVVTSALIEYALALESNKTHQSSNYSTPYGMTIVRTGGVTHKIGIFKFFIENLNRIAAIIAHIDSAEDEFMDYISRGKKPVYTFVLKGKGFTDFEFLHVATDGSSFFEECLTLLVLDFENYRGDIRFNVLRAEFFQNRWGEKSISDYIPSLDKMADVFFQDESYLFGGGGGQVSHTWDLNWEANVPPYNGLDIQDTRFVDYSHALVGLKDSSFAQNKYGVEALIRSGVLAVERDLLHRRFRCMCDGWTEEHQNLDVYELGLIFGKHFGMNSFFSPARFLHEISSLDDHSNALVYVEKGKRIEVLPMNWSDSWFTYYSDGNSNSQGWSILYDDPNPFRLYDMNDFYPKHLEMYKQSKKKPKQQ